MIRRWLRRWPVAVLLLAALALAATLAAVVLRDWRIRLRTLVKLDPPATPVEVRRDGFRLAVTGASVTGIAELRLSLRAWAPGPVVRVVEAAGPGTIVVTTW